jgi:hypothetical protein
MVDLVKLSVVTACLYAFYPCETALSDTLTCEGTQKFMMLKYPEGKRTEPVSLIIDINRSILAKFSINLKISTNSWSETRKFTDGYCGEDALAESYKSCVSKITETPSEFKIYKRYEFRVSSVLFKAVNTETISINRMSGKLTSVRVIENGWTSNNELSQSEYEISADCSKGNAKF